jgi:energy-coupling factor transport system ATP-binding protein
MPLAFEHVTYSYGSQVDGMGPALDDVSLTIADGEFVGVIGHTGSGKSTFAEHTNGLKVPTSGRVLVDGIPTSDKKARREVRRRVGYVMQYPEYQLFAETVREDVGFGPRNLGQSDDEVDRSVREAIELVGLDYDEVADVSPFDLSGGQKRRVAMAGIIAMRPHILTVDEPMAGLDPQGRHEVLGILRELHRRGTTVIMVSHSMDDVAREADHVVVLDHGRLADEGDPRTVFSHEERLHRIGLDVPRAAHVAHDLAERGMNLPGPCPLTLEDLARAIATRLGREGDAR